MSLKAFFRRFRRKRDFEVEADAIYRERVGKKLRVKNLRDGFQVVDYGGDIEAYKAIQTVANKAKIDWRSVKRENISHLCDRLARDGLTPKSVLCHGTRNGAEQGYFKERLPDAEVLGTEISDNATQFPMTIQWDFHEVKPEWLGAIDLVFSNSWDHTYDPRKLFGAWMSCIAPGGALALEWSRIHADTPADAVDPTRATLEGLIGLLSTVKPTGFNAPEVFDGLPQSKRNDQFVVLRRTT